MPRVAALALVSTALLVAGCGERVEPLEPDLEAYPVAVRGAAEDETRLERRPERIAALTPGAAELVSALGAGERLVGVPFGWSGEEGEDATRVVRASGILVPDAIAAAAPDLIVASPANGRAEVAAAERSTGAAVYVQPSSSVDGVLASVIELGLLVGEPARGRALAGQIRRGVDAVGAQVADRRRVRAFVDTGFLATVPRDSLVADLVRHAGGDPVGDDVSALGPLAACRLLTLRLDVVLRVLEAGSTAPSPEGALRRCPGDRGVPRIVHVPAELAAEAGPRIADAVLAIARTLHPDAFR